MGAASSRANCTNRLRRGRVDLVVAAGGRRRWHGGAAQKARAAASATPEREQMRCFKGPQAERNHAGQAGPGGRWSRGRWSSLGPPAGDRHRRRASFCAWLTLAVCPGSEPGTRDRTPYSWNSRDSSDSPETGEDQTLLWRPQGSASAVCAWHWVKLVTRQHTRPQPQMAPMNEATMREITGLLASSAGSDVGTAVPTGLIGACRRADLVFLRGAIAPPHWLSHGLRASRVARRRVGR